MSKSKIVILIVVCLLFGVALGVIGYIQLAKSTPSTKEYPTTMEDPQTGEVLNSLVNPANHDYDEIANALYQICFNQPETLASTVTAFPEMLQAAGYDETDPIEFEKIFNQPGSIEDQNRVLWLLRDILENPDTEFDFVKWSGDVKIMGMVKVDESQPSSPQNITLAWFEDTLDDAKVVTIAVPRSDGGYDQALLHLGSGFCRFVPIGE